MTTVVLMSTVVFMSNASPASASIPCPHCLSLTSPADYDESLCTDECYAVRQAAESKAYRLACIERELALDGFAIESAVWS